MVLAPQYGSSGSGLTVEQAALLADALTYDSTPWAGGTTYPPNTLVRKVAGGTVYLQADTVDSTGDDPASGAPWEVWDESAAGYPETLAATHDHIAGRFYAQVGAGLAPILTTVALANGRCDLHLRVFDRAVTFDQLGMWVTTGVAGNAKVLVYDSDADGWPDNLIFESADLDVSGTNTFAHDTASLPAFVAGVRYWIGIIGGTTATVRGVQSTGLRASGMAASSDGAVAYAIRRSGLTFATPPDPWVFTATDLTTSNTVAVIGRAS